ncbi:MAG: MBL fold metallo-hydrolase [Sphingopyxis sp.]|nr:MBL fold metallo-hydrolase [Sphingopyxis sp.]
MRRRLKPVLIVLFTLIVGGGGWITWQLRSPPAPPASQRLPISLSPTPALRAQFFGATTLLLRDRDHAVMIDALLSRPGMCDVLFGTIGPDAARVDSVLKRGKVDKIDLLFITHSHYDHSLDAAAIARRTGAIIIGSASTQQIALGGGVGAARTRLVAGGERFDAGSFRVTAFRSRHSPGDHVPGVITGPIRPPAKAQDYKNGGTYAYLVEHGGLRILVHASANYVPDMYRGVKADIVFIAIGGLGAQPADFVERYWRETVGATGARLVIPTHWDNFVRPLDGPFVPLPRLMDDVPAAIAKIESLAKHDRVTIRTMPPVAPVDIAAALPARR